MGEVGEFKLSAVIINNIKILNDLKILINLARL
jgi:hypothetical protein